MTEILYACTFDSRSERRIAHVRAWDPGDALELFVAELRSEGITEDGDVEVAPLHGEGRASAEFHPEVTAP
jgi:hypothetical protein